MKLTKTEKTDFAIKLKARVNEAFAVETQSSKVELYYPGVCKITHTLEEEFAAKAGEFPVIMNGACHLARAFLNPDQIESKGDLKKGMGLLVGTAGGVSIVWGILSVTNIGFVSLALLFGIHPMLAPVAILGGVAVAVTGAYTALAKQTPQARLAKAHNVLIEAISNWADEKAAEEKDVAAKQELMQNYARAQTAGTKGSIIWRTLTWPYRTAYDFVDAKPKNIDQPSHKPPSDGG
jgi:hypothetical protein